MIQKKILITGGTGLVGSLLTEQLKDAGHQVCYLSRSAGTKNGVKAYRWDIEKQEIDGEALHGVDHIIHLAGAGVADDRWTDERKKVILDSRVKSTKLLYKTLSALQDKHQVKSFVSASAIGYYGFHNSEEMLDESSSVGDDFLANVTQAWEESCEPIARLGIRVVKIRIGIVLSEKGGALQKIAQPVKWGVGAPLGTGNQYMSWIHIEDLCGIFRFALNNESMEGPYNGVAPNPLTNSDFTAKVAKVLRKPYFLPAVPAFILRLLLGEMAQIVLTGSKVSPDKIIEEGYMFRFKEADRALKNLLGHESMS